LLTTKNEKMKKVIIAALALMVVSAASFAETVPAKSSISTTTAGSLKKDGLFDKLHQKKNKKKHHKKNHKKHHQKKHGDKADKAAKPGL
jgi:hypothetical protein